MCRSALSASRIAAKLVALAIFGKGHWLGGIVVMITAYGVSILFIHRCFRIVKPKLLKLRWFATVWRMFTGLRAKVLAPFT